MTISVLVEGWLRFPHSYALVNLYQILNLQRDVITNLYIKELPPYNTAWKEICPVEKGILTQDQWDYINGLPRWKGEKVDVIYRISTPLFLDKPVPNVPVVLFYTAEFQNMKHQQYNHGTKETLKDLVADGAFTLITPSRWSAQAAAREDLDVHVIPHGVDTSVLFPDQQLGKMTRENMGIPMDAKVILSIGAMTGNKNLTEVLRVFYKTSLTRDNVYLVLKGTDELYRSRDFVMDAVKALIRDRAFDKKTWGKLMKSGRFIYLNETLSYEEMRGLYNASDLYLAPYIAEGFCMPVLEAMACGVSCMVTQGGPTEDFIIKSSCVAVQSVPLKNDAEQYFLQVVSMSLHNDLIRVLDDNTIRQRAQENATLVKEKYSWEKVGQDLTNYLHTVVYHTSHPSHPIGYESVSGNKHA